MGGDLGGAVAGEDGGYCLKSDAEGYVLSGTILLGAPLREWGGFVNGKVVILGGDGSIPICNDPSPL